MFVFVEISSKFLFRGLQVQLAGSAMQLADWSLQSSLKRDSARFFFILMYAIASRRQPTQASRASVTFLEEFCPAGLFLVERADSAAWPHRNRGTCGFTRDPAKSLSPPQRYYFPKALNGAAKSILESRVSDMVSNWCSLEHIFYITSSTALR